jgi:hypothetical protein
MPDAGQVAFCTLSRFSCAATLCRVLHIQYPSQYLWKYSHWNSATERANSSTIGKTVRLVEVLLNVDENIAKYCQTKDGVTGNMLESPVGKDQHCRWL